MSYRKLIETELPIEKINAEAEREKTARNGLPSNIHIWWTRTPMAVTRSVLFASLIDDPSEHPELFVSDEEQNSERKRLLSLVERLADVECIDDKDVVNEAKEEVKKYNNGQLPIVYDPFAGGGATPVEAHRLGLKTISADINGVASIITTVASDIPARFSNKKAIHPRENMVLSIEQSGLNAFVEDVRFYGDLLRKRAFERIGKLYPKVGIKDTGGELDASAWIWARTIKCPNPSCRCSIPLSSSYDLAKKKGSEAWVEPIVEDGDIRFRIHREPRVESKGNPKVAQTAVFRCPLCGEITTDSYVKECGIKHEIDSRLIAIVVDRENKRDYLEATDIHEKAAKIEAPRKVAHGQLPIFPKRFSPPSFGLTDYADLFTNRQLMFITAMMDLAKEIEKEIITTGIDEGLANDGRSFAEGGNGALAYAEAIRIILVLTVSKLLDRCSNLCSWSNSGGGSLRNVFSRAAMPMIWDYAEANPFANAGGSFANALERTCDSLMRLPTGVEGKTYMSDATLPNEVRNALISTDLPYYDRAAYQELSDFFYVWLKYGIADIFPEYFKGNITSKKDDLTAFSYRYDGDKHRANAIYAEGLKLVFERMIGSASNEYPANVGFVYKGNDGLNKEELSEWEQFVTAVSDAGFSITASWPLGRKYENSVELAETRGIPITVVLRKKDNDAQQITRRSFVASVKREIPILLDEISNKVLVMDLRPSLIGRALNIYTRNRQVLDADGSFMKPHMASRIIEQEIDTLISSYYSNGVAIATSEEETDYGRES